VKTNGALAKGAQEFATDFILSTVIALTGRIYPARNLALKYFAMAWGTILVFFLMALLYPAVLIGKGRLPLAICFSEIILLTFYPLGALRRSALAFVINRPPRSFANVAAMLAALSFNPYENLRARYNANVPRPFSIWGYASIKRSLF